MTDQLPALGVGLTYSSALHSFIEGHLDLVDFIEVEPQTIWSRSADGDLEIVGSAYEPIRELPCRKLLHGIGFPVGGTLPPKPDQIPLLRRMIEDLAVPWMSEHLSFNRVSSSKGTFNTGMLLPPRQTEGGVAAAVRSIAAMTQGIEIPLAIENGVNYLRTRTDELADGEFVARVATAANCGILLDLHNLWTNQQNGRQSIRDFLSSIPLERVWEVHLAGGMERNGFWLDSHSGKTPVQLLEQSCEIIAQLPNLKAITFEFFSPYIAKSGINFFVEHLRELRDLWSSRARARDRSPNSTRPNIPSPLANSDSIGPEEWEEALGSLVVNRPIHNSFSGELETEKGIAVFQDLLAEFRAGMVISTLRLSSRLLMLHLGSVGFRSLLNEFWRSNPPELFASAEGAHFGTFLASRNLEIPQQRSVLEFDLAVLNTLRDRQPRIVPFSTDPLPLLRALSDGVLPEISSPGNFEVEVTPDTDPHPRIDSPEVLH